MSQNMQCKKKQTSGNAFKTRAQINIDEVYLYADTKTGKVVVHRNSWGIMEYFHLVSIGFDVTEYFEIIFNYTETSKQIMG